MLHLNLSHLRLPPSLPIPVPNVLLVILDAANHRPTQWLLSVEFSYLTFAPLRWYLLRTARLVEHVLALCVFCRVWEPDLIVTVKQTDSLAWQFLNPHCIIALVIFL